MRNLASVIAAACLLACTTAAKAASLQVVPISIDLTAPASATTLTLRNTGDTPIAAQVRVFRWTQTNGADALQATQAVVASPPVVRIPANGEQIVRIVRVSKTPPATEEAYRLLVDELPSPSGTGAAAVSLLLQYSIPAFIGPAARGRPAVSWRVAVLEDKVTVSATNNGDRRMRLSDLSIARPDGATAFTRPGLVGYVLGRSARSFDFKLDRPLAVGERVSLGLQTDDGPVRAAATVDAQN
jgi:fimbrial chaperone protein